MRWLSKLSPTRLRNKICLVRIDLNIEKGDEDDSIRTKAIAPTVTYLLKNKAKVVLMSHRGRPEKSEDRKELSLQSLTNTLENVLKRKLVFMSEPVSEVLREKIKKEKSQLILLENLRFYPEEATNKNSFGKELARLGDLYINEAFAVCHRKNASICAITKNLSSYAGLWLEKELAHLDRARKVTAHPFTIILGGAKISDKLGIIKYFYKKADHFLLGGGAANTFLKAKGIPVGKSLVDNSVIPKLKPFLSSPKIEIPTDMRERESKNIDIGPLTAKRYSEIIRQSKAVIWSGPLGLMRGETFEPSSKAIAEAVAASKGFTIAGGGETTVFIARSHLEKRFTFISTGGGAMLEYLEGKELPGIEALK